MKKFLTGLFLALVMGAGSLFAMGSFEGVVNYEITTDGGKKMDMEYMIKGKKFRSNMSHSGMEASTIMDLEAKTATTLMHKQKMYMTHKLDKAMTAASKPKVKGKFYKASGSKEVLGYSCEHWIYEGAAGKTDMWVASGIGTFMGINSGNGSMGADDWVKAIKGKGFFPMEIDSTGKSGKTMTMQVTKLEKQSLSDSLFQVPSDYKKMPGFEGMGKAGGKQINREDILKGMKPKLPF